jgi:hypothetical protein
MRIITPTEIEQVAWEGTLEPQGAAFKDPAALPKVTIGEPTFWAAEQALAGETGKRWSPPGDGKRYTLVRLACTLHPPAAPRTRYAEATLTATLSPRGGARLIVAHDLYPLRATADSKRTYTVKLSPALKFADAVDAKLGEAGAEIEYHHVFPVIQGFGLGERQPYWRFAHHAASPLLGSQSVYLVVAAPRDAGDVQVAVALVANVETRFGPFRAGLPESAQAYVVRTIAVG